MKDTLPTKPSELLEVALSDLIKCEKDPETYEIDMMTWHYYQDHVCTVCLAGSVMAQTLALAPDANCHIQEVKDLELRDKLNFISGVALGLTISSIEYMSRFDIFLVPGWAIQLRHGYVDYANDKDLFKQWVQKVITYFKENRL